MPLPLILGIGAAIAGVAGVGTGISGGVKMKKAGDAVKSAKEENEKLQRKLSRTTKTTNSSLDALGKKELEIISTFEHFSNQWEKIQNIPSFAEINAFDASLPEYDLEELRKVSVAASITMGGLGGAALGTAGGFAAAGATTTAVMALGTASTGTAISTLSGVAATNATLAALGGGSIAAGGGGMALGSAVLGGATLGVGLLVGGIIFNVSGSKLENKANRALEQMYENKEVVNKACVILDEITVAADNYYCSLLDVEMMYEDYMCFLDELIAAGRCDWNGYSYEERKKLKNLVLFVQLLYKMCSISLVLRDGDDISVNEEEISQVNAQAEAVLETTENI